VTWVLQDWKRHGIKHPVDFVNENCIGQCNCEAEDVVSVDGKLGRNGTCGALVEDSKCKKDVDWAMEHGIHLFPKWYPGLSIASSTNEFQEFLFRRGNEECSRPCEDCRTAVEGEECYAAVTSLLGVWETVDKYWRSKLLLSEVRETVFKQLQEHLRLANSSAKCPKPCALCHTALEGEQCHEAVLWVMQNGIKRAFDLYPGLTESSSFEDVQTALHHADIARCSMPCELGSSRTESATSRTSGNSDSRDGSRSTRTDGKSSSRNSSHDASHGGDDDTDRRNNHGDGNGGSRARKSGHGGQDRNHSVGHGDGNNSDGSTGNSSNLTSGGDVDGGNAAGLAANYGGGSGGDANGHAASTGGGSNSSDDGASHDRAAAAAAAAAADAIDRSSRRRRWWF